MKVISPDIPRFEMEENQNYSPVDALNRLKSLYDPKTSTVYLMKDKNDGNVNAFKESVIDEHIIDILDYGNVVNNNRIERFAMITKDFDNIPEEYKDLPPYVKEAINSYIHSTDKTYQQFKENLAQSAVEHNHYDLSESLNSDKTTHLFLKENFIERHKDLVQFSLENGVVIPDFNIDNFGISDRGNIIFTALEKIKLIESSEFPPIWHHPSMIVKSDITQKVKNIEEGELYLTSGLQRALKNIQDYDAILYEQIKSEIIGINGYELNNDKSTSLVVRLPYDKDNVMLISSVNKDTSRCDAFIFDLGKTFDLLIAEAKLAGQINGTHVTIVEKTEQFNIGPLNRFIFDIAIQKAFKKDGNLADNIYREAEKIGMNTDYIAILDFMQEDSLRGIEKCIQSLKQAGITVERLSLSDFGVDKDGNVKIADVKNLRTLSSDLELPDISENVFKMIDYLENNKKHHTHRNDLTP